MSDLALQRAYYELLQEQSRWDAMADMAAWSAPSVEHMKAELARHDSPGKLKDLYVCGSIQLDQFEARLERCLAVR